MAHEISASWSKLSEDSCGTVAFYYRELQRQFPTAPPEVMAAMLQAAARENAAITQAAVEQDKVAAINRLADALNSLDFGN